MADNRYQIVFAGDFREPLSWWSTAVDQLIAVAKAGYRAGFLQCTGERARRPARLHHDIRRLCASHHLAHLDPDQTISTDLLLIPDPLIFGAKPRRILRVDANHQIILMPYGPASAGDREPTDWAEIHHNTMEALPGEPIWAPMNWIVRDWLERLSPKLALNSIDWHDCIDVANWRKDRSGFCSSRPVIGRSGRPDADAWPRDSAEIMALYPDDPQFQVRLLNGGPNLRQRIGYYPRNWIVLTSDEVCERDFLTSIDFFVYGHHADVACPVDPSLLKAMASGAVAILPPSFEPIFGDAAVYAEPQQTRSTVWDLYANDARYRAVSDAGRNAVASSFGPNSLLERVSQLIGPPAYPLTEGLNEERGRTPAPCRSRRRAMFITINGVGMGHLTRMLAIAKRCAPSIEPVFITMSQALKVLREQGYLAEFIPSRQYLDCDINQWNSFLRDELSEMISFYDPAVVVFDGNVPYKGLIDAIKDNPEPWFIWSRRGMWRSQNTDIISREQYFDVVLEPGDLAAGDDHGITTRYQDRTHHISPVRLLDRSEMLSRADARSELGLDSEKPAVLIQLGAGNNFDYRSIHNTAMAHISQRYDAQIAVGEWLISDQPIDFPENVFRMPGYPFARYFRAFDLAVSAVGYNSFHELLFAGIPTILVPNEAMEQDHQLSRALYADRNGLAICVRTKEIYKLTATIDKLIQRDERERIKVRLGKLDPANGAAEAAAFVEEMAYSRRVDRP